MVVRQLVAALRALWWWWKTSFGETECMRDGPCASYLITKRFVLPHHNQPSTTSATKVIQTCVRSGLPDGGGSAWLIAHAVSSIRSQTTPTSLFQIRSAAFFADGGETSMFGPHPPSSPDRACVTCGCSPVGRDARELTKIDTYRYQAPKNRENKGSFSFNSRGSEFSLRLQEPSEPLAQIGVTG